MSETKNQKLDLQVLSRVIGLAKPYRLTFALAGILAVILAPVVILRPYLVQVMVDDYIFVNDINGLTFIAILFAGVLVGEAIIRYAFIYSTNWLGQMVIRDLRIKVFDHISSLKLTYFDRTPIGQSTTRTINDIETINTVFSQGIITILADLLTVIAVLGIMLFISWKLTLICLTVMPFMIVSSIIFKENVKKAFQTVRAQISKMNAFLQERITGMRIVQIFNAEKQEMEKFKKINRSYTQANLDSIFYYAVFYPVVELISATSLALMVWWGARGVVQNEVTFGALVAFPIYLSRLFRPIQMIADKFGQLQMGLVASERVFNILDSQQTIPDNGHIQVDKLKGKIAFDHVSFAYNARDYVLKDLSFNVAPGTSLAIVGSTGSGKSTIINLLNRFYDIQKGQILIDGESISAYKLDALRNRIGMVLQDVFLFSGSVYDNITLRDPSISEETVIESAKMIGAHEFIMRLPDGYQYEVMERGATLSMGQRQLISFVRALVFDPDILILDEATSSIDPESESIIQYAIEKLIAKRTSIIIAHRLSTIRNADQILVLEKGKVLENGNHKELIEIEDGHYRKMYEMQVLQHETFGNS